MKSKIQALYDSDHYNTENQKSSRFNKLNPEVVHELFKQRPSYEYIKEIAVARLEKTITDQLQLLTLVDACDYNNMDNISKNIFSWSRKEFMKRRALDNCIWIDVMKKHTKGDCLEEIKINTDVNEVKVLLKLILKGSQRSNGHFDLDSLDCKPLSEVDSYFNIFELLQSEKIKLTADLQDLEIRFNARLFTKRQTQQQLILWSIEETMLNAQTWDPMELRFQMNWYQCKTEQTQLQSNLKLNDVQREIDQYKFKMLTEKITGDNIRDTYYTLAEQHKHDINVLQNRLEGELDEIDNKINYTRLQISKLIDQQTLMSEQIKEFQKEIKKRLEKDECERQEQELERLRLEKEDFLNKRTNAKKATNKS